MEHKIAETNARIDVADVLRGLAVMGIILLHSIEHFNFYSFPEEVPFEWMKFTDQAIWRGLFFTFSNKAYAVFALLFGFSFYIQDNNQQRRGKDFRLRFLWRLFILFMIGQFNAAFFTGEILTMYAIVEVIHKITSPPFGDLSVCHENDSFDVECIVRVRCIVISVSQLGISGETNPFFQCVDNLI